MLRLASQGARQHIENEYAERKTQYQVCTIIALSYIHIHRKNNMKQINDVFQKNIMMSKNMKGSKDVMILLQFYGHKIWEKK